MKRISLITFLIVTCVFLSAYENQAEELVQITPVDQGAISSSFYEFRRLLRAAIVNQDSTFLLKHIHQNIMMNSTRAENMRMYALYFTEDEIDLGKNPIKSEFEEFITEYENRPSNEKEFIRSRSRYTVQSI